MIHYIYCEPLLKLAFLTFAFLIVFAIVNVNFSKIKKIINILLLIIGIYFVLKATIIGRSGNHFGIELRPFYTFVKAQMQPEYYRTYFMNTLLFVPLGCSLPNILHSKAYKINICITIIISFAFSIVIELLQYYYHLGSFEIDDIIANTFGAAIGTLSYLLYIRILKNRKENLMNCEINNNQKLLMDLCAKALFDKQCVIPNEIDVNNLLDEAKRQTVLPHVFPLIKDRCGNKADLLFNKIIAKNIRVEFGHNEVHNALSNAGIPYTVIKGVASASFYKEPMLRMMGDIDILVSPENIKATNDVLTSIGFTTDDELTSDSHIAYERRDGIICELHHSINGIPRNDVGSKINNYFIDIINNSIEYKMSNGVCIIPCKFHHGLILLIHTAKHLTSDGVGLRHLCDWAVFVNSFSDDEFVSLFKEKLENIGLWRFARLLTLCCVKYLGCNAKAWAGELDDDIIDLIASDILNGGNFGHKDPNRSSQIKYLSDRKSGLKAKKSPIIQLLSSINQKSKSEFKFADKFVILLPIAWVFTICKYFYNVIIGKKRLDGIGTIRGAKHRKEIYEQFKLYEK